MTKSRSWFLGVVFFISLFLPFRWIFWLGWQRLNYFSLSFGLAEAWIIVSFFLFLFRQRRWWWLFLLLFVGGYLSKTIFISYWWLHFYFYLKWFLLTLTGCYFLRLVKKEWLEKLYFFTLLILVLSGVGEFLWTNFISLNGSFRYFFFGRYWYLSHLFFSHPNVFAFALVSLFWSWFLVSKNKKDKLVWLIVALGIVISGSFTGGVILFGWSLLFQPSLWWLTVPLLLLTGVTTDWTSAGLHFGWLFFSPGQGGFWPTLVVSKTIPHLSYWSTQPVHNTFYLVSKSLGWFYLLILIGVLFGLGIRSNKKGRWILIFLILWGLIDHFFLTTYLGSNMTAFLLVNLWLFGSKKGVPGRI